MKGRLIVIEGIDGAGGEVQSKLLLEYLRNKNMQAVRLSYPDYGTPIGRMIHDFLHKKHEFNDETLFFLHAIDRIKDRKRIEGFLKEGTTVVCDRYYTSILAYQCSHGIPLEKALRIAEMFEVPKPDMVLLLNVKPETSMERKKGEKSELDRNESDRVLLEGVSKQYAYLAENNIFGKWVLIDGEKTKQEVLKEILKNLDL